MSVKNFLRSSKIIYQSMVKKHVVLGNQSADLDSIVSSISMAYYLSNKNRSSYVPIINSTKKIIQSKKECMYLFDYFSINLDEDLVFISDWNVNEILEVVLVDHNELDLKEKELGISKLVKGIVDHHVDKNLFLDSDPRIVDISVGSCATLSADFLLKSNFDIDDSLATMLLFPILSDTCNLKSRTSQKDIEIVETLKNISKINIETLYEKIEKFKLDQSDEDINTILVKDYKQYENGESYWGLSSISFSVKNILNDSNNLNLITEFMIEKRLYFYGILSCFKPNNSDEFKRDLVLFADENLIEKIQSNLTTNLKFVSKFNTSKTCYIVYDIDHVNFTRKYWQPILENLLKN